MAEQQSKVAKLNNINKLRQFINKRLIVQIDVTASSHRDQIHCMTASHWSNGYYL